MNARPASVSRIPFRVRTNRRWPSSRSSEWSLAVSVGWVTKSASAARLTLPRRATSRKPSTWTRSMPSADSLRGRTKNGLWRSASIRRFGLCLEPHRAGQDEQHRQGRDRRTQVEGWDDADPGAQDPAEERSDRDGPPHDRAHGRVEPALEPDRNDRLPEADLVDVVDAAGQEQHEEGGAEERERVAQSRERDQEDEGVADAGRDRDRRPEPDPAGNRDRGHGAQQSSDAADPEDHSDLARRQPELVVGEEQEDRLPDVAAQVGGRRAACDQPDDRVAEHDLDPLPHLAKEARRRLP